MILNDKTLDYLEEHLPELMATATKQAYWQTLASGQSVLIAENGNLIEVFPDGTRTVIKTITKPIPGATPEKIRLWLTNWANRAYECLPVRMDQEKALWSR